MIPPKLNSTGTNLSTYYPNQFKLSEKTAVVCGGLGLIGQEITKALAQAGAKVIILDINLERGAKFESECRQQGLEVNFLLFDVAKLDAFEKEIALVDKKYGPINIWINTAYPRTEDWGNKIESITVDSWKKNVDLHMNSYCLSTKYIAELMKQNKVEGSIINLGSIYGVVAPDFNLYPEDMTCPAAYSAIKGGIINFSRYAASYYGPAGIRINSVCPGGVLDHQEGQFVHNYNSKVPLRRMAAPQDVASAVLFLASEAASYITGVTLMVDGGWSII